MSPTILHAAVLEQGGSESDLRESAKKFVERVRGYAAKREQAVADGESYLDRREPGSLSKIRNVHYHSRDRWYFLIREFWHYLDRQYGEREHSKNRT
jgi:hypothetical protein